MPPFCAGLLSDNDDGLCWLPFVHSAQPVGDERPGDAGCLPSFVTSGAVLRAAAAAIATALSKILGVTADLLQIYSRCRSR